MAISVKSDTMAQSGASQTYEHLFIKRCFLVNNVGAGSTPDNIWGIASNAPGIPQMGAFHPTQSNAVAVKRDFQPVPNDDQACYVVVTYETNIYGGFSPVNIHISGSLISYETHTDFQGYPTGVRYFDPAGHYHSQIAVVPALMPQLTITATRYEFSHPVALSFQYLGCIDSGNFLGAPAQHQWKVIGVEADKLAPSYYHTQYTLQWRSDGWDARGFYLNDLGRVPPDILSSTPMPWNTLPANTQNGQYNGAGVFQMAGDVSLSAGFAWITL